MKKCERRCEQAQEETARKEEDLATSRGELVEANEELDRLRRKFRDQLENLVSGKVRNSFCLWMVHSAPSK